MKIDLVDKNLTKIEKEEIEKLLQRQNQNIRQRKIKFAIFIYYTFKREKWRVK